MKLDLTALGRITDTLIDKWNNSADAITSTYLRITDRMINLWNDAAIKAHQHRNKSFIDSLNETSILTYTGSGEVNQAQSLGGYSDVYKAKSGEVLTFRSIRAGTGIQVTEASNYLTITNTGAISGHAYDYTIVAISAGTTYQSTLYAVNTIIERKKVGYSSANAYFVGSNIYIDGTNEMKYETILTANQNISVTHSSEDRIIVTPSGSGWGVLTVNIWREA